MPIKVGSKRPTQRKRKDPKPRHVDGSLPYVELLNKNPNRHYVLVNKADKTGGIDYYEALGYQVEEYTGAKGALRFKNIKPRKGQPLESRDVVVMSCSLERWAEIIEEGPHGNTGLEEADEIERRMERGAEVRGYSRELERDAHGSYMEDGLTHG